jgi:thymidylate kinase
LWVLRAIYHDLSWDVSEAFRGGTRSLESIPRTEKPGLRRGDQGRFIILVGPDGVGKTTLASELTNLAETRSAYFHYRPIIRAGLKSAPPDEAGDPPPKNKETGWKIVGWIRLIRSALQFAIAYHIRIKPLIRRGFLVIGDRWLFNYFVQPLSVRYYGPEWLARLAFGIVPGPDLIVNLVAPPAVIESRKRELNRSEIQLELERWRNLPTLAPLVTYDATSPPDELARMILEDTGWSIESDIRTIQD